MLAWWNRRHGFSHKKEISWPFGLGPGLRRTEENEPVLVPLLLILLLHYLQACRDGKGKLVLNRGGRSLLLGFALPCFRWQIWNFQKWKWNCRLGSMPSIHDDDDDDSWRRRKGIRWWWWWCLDRHVSAPNSPRWCVKCLFKPSKSRTKPWVKPHTWYRSP